MRQTRRRGLSASQKQELWERWKRGQSRNDIARALAKNRGSIHYALACNGPTRSALQRLASKSAGLPTGRAAGFKIATSGRAARRST